MKSQGSDSHCLKRRGQITAWLENRLRGGTDGPTVSVARSRFFVVGGDQLWLPCGLAKGRLCRHLRGMSLDRFHQAQAGRWSGYPTALAEIRQGGKRSHWIWYVFPQIDGLGRSSTARSYALRDLDEACAYLRDPVLRQRYEEITAAVAEQLANGVSLETLMGGSTDALKLVSSLTLFRAAASKLAQGEAGSDFTRLAQLSDSILQRTAAQGFAPCQFTDAHCKNSAPP